jgi:hypothetical protein
MICLPADLETTQRLWSLVDGTVCVLNECDGPPRFAVSLVRHTRVLQQKRVHDEHTARRLAETWRQSAGGTPERR